MDEPEYNYFYVVFQGAMGVGSMAIPQNRVPGGDHTLNIGDCHRHLWKTLGQPCTITNAWKITERRFEEFNRFLYEMHTAGQAKKSHLEVVAPIIPLNPKGDPNGPEDQPPGA